MRQHRLNLPESVAATLRSVNYRIKTIDVVEHNTDTEKCKQEKSHSYAHYRLHLQ